MGENAPQACPVVPLKSRAAPIMPFAFKPGQTGNPGGRPKNPFDLTRRCKQLGPRAIEVLEAYLNCGDFRAALPAARMILATGFAEFEKAAPAQADVQGGFDKLTHAQRIEILNTRREARKAADAALAPLPALPGKVTPVETPAKKGKA